jgi:hypothetical protein
VPGATGAPFAEDIMLGLARSIETLSAHAAEFGVGMAATSGLTLVPPRSVTGD